MKIRLKFFQFKIFLLIDLKTNFAETFRDQFFHKVKNYLAIIVDLLFVQVNPSHNDKVSQQVRGTLGEYESVKHLLDEPGRLLGFDGVPPPSPAPTSTPSPRLPQPPPAQEFKTPKASSQQQSSHHHSHTSAQRSAPACMEYKYSYVNINLSKTTLCSIRHNYN